MAGTLVISTLSDGTNSTSATNPIRGSAKAWVNFDGTNAFSPNPSTSAIRAQYNVSSITKNTTGDYTVNFTNSLGSTTYIVAGVGSASSTSSGTRIIMIADGGQASGSCRIFSVYSAVTPADSLYITVAFI